MTSWRSFDLNQKLCNFLIWKIILSRINLRIEKRWKLKESVVFFWKMKFYRKLLLNSKISNFRFLQSNPRKSNLSQTLTLSWKHELIFSKKNISFPLFWREKKLSWFFFKFWRSKKFFSPWFCFIFPILLFKSWEVYWESLS